MVVIEKLVQPTFRSHSLWCGEGLPNALHRKYSKKFPILQVIFLEIARTSAKHGDFAIFHPSVTRQPSIHLVNIRFL